MAYQTQTFTDNETVLTAAMMDHIEAGIVANETSIEDVSTDLASHYVQKNAIASSFDETTPYTKGQYVWYENVLCRFLVDHEPGAFVEEEVEYVSEDGLSGELNEQGARTEFVMGVLSLVDYGLDVERELSPLPGSTLSTASASFNNGVFVLTGSTAKNSTPGKVFVDYGRQIVTGGTSMPSGSVQGVTLADGHTYRVRMEHISGSYSGDNTYVNPVFLEPGSAAAQGTDGVLVYDASTYDHGIFAGVSIGRNNDTDGITFSEDGYKFRLIVEDITNTGDKNIAPIDDTTAKDTHQPGDLLTVSGQLYKATQAIAPGTAITPGTNVVETTVAAQLAERDTAIANRVQLTEQSLTDTQKEQARENIGAVGTDEMSAEFLCQMLFGNEDDWSVSNYDSMSYSATKTGRIITYKGNNTSNSGFQSINLTGVPGAPHTARSGNFSNITLADTDFVPIPSTLKAISKQSATYPVVLFLSGYMHYDRYNDDGHAGFTFDYVLRRYNTKTETYEYTTRTTTNLGLINTPTTADSVDRISIAQLIPDGRGGDYVVNWDEWEEMAIFAMRRNRMFSGTMLLTPSLEIYGDQKPVIYSAEQTLTAAEQEQARENIGAASLIPNGTAFSKAIQGGTTYDVRDGDIATAIGFQKIDLSTATAGKYVNSSGGLSNGTYYAYMATGIPVKSGDTVLFHARGYSTTVAMIYLCDQDGSNRVPVIMSNGDTVQDYTYIAQADGYVGLCYYITGAARAYIAHYGAVSDNIVAIEGSAADALSVKAYGPQFTGTDNGVTITKSGRRATLNGTKTGGAFRCVSVTNGLVATTNDSPTANHVNQDAVLYAGRTYEIWFRVISGTYSQSSNKCGVWMFTYDGTTPHSPAISSDLLATINGGGYASIRRTFTTDTKVGFGFYLRTGCSFSNLVIEYGVQDITSRIDGARNLAPVDTITAAATHAMGDLLTVNGTLYKATQAIATGETITSGTNVASTTVAEQLAERDAAIAELEHQDTLISDTLHRLSLTPFEKRLFTTCERNIVTNTGVNHRIANVVYNSINSLGEDRSGSTYRTVWLTGDDPGPTGQITAMSTFARSRFAHFTVASPELKKLIISTHRVGLTDSSFSNAFSNPPQFFVFTYDPATDLVYWGSWSPAALEVIDAEYGLSQCLAYGNIAIAVQFRRPTQTIDWKFNVNVARKDLSPYIEDIPEKEISSSEKYIEQDEFSPKATT